jgi:predicted RNA-binding protein with RPS1 domain
MEYGVFITLPSGHSGLAHRSRLDINDGDEVADYYSVGDPIDVEILSWQGSRISLAKVAAVTAE